MRTKKFNRLLALVTALTVAVTGVSWPSSDVQAVETTLPCLSVDMSKTGERELFHGATGWLYGQGADEVPTANTITALKPNTAVQKAPNGMQHPNGDVLDIAETFKNAGGKYIQIYVPDYYALWFYEFTGTEYYLNILRMQAEACIDAGIAEDVVYVLYNEPTADWIGGSYKDQNGNTVTGWDSMNWFWLDMVELLREVYQEYGIASAPKTAGLNLAWYQEDVMENYVKFCAEHDCMPDVVTWHDLATWQYNIFDQEYSHYRSLEKKYNVEPREICINEYAAQAECSSPGDLVRWIGLWEDYEVAGCLPFWHFSNNLNGLAADVNEGNGAWWLYKWYGDMSGSYLPVSVANASQDDFYGAASMDENKKNAEVIFGGRDGSAEIVLDHITDTVTFQNAEKVHVKVESSDYTGFHGAAEEPRVVKEGVVSVREDGSVVIPMSGMNEMSGYHITVTQAAETDPVGLLEGTWKAVYEAEDGALTGKAKADEADGSYASSKRKRVSVLDDPGDSVTITVDVPRDGYYKYDMVYCAATGVNTNDPDNNTPYTAVQTLTIDGEGTHDMILPSTLHWSMGSMYSEYVYLTKGSHKFRIEATNSQGNATVDCIYLTWKGKSEEDTAFDKTYEAELGEFNEIKGATTTLTTVNDGGVGYITGLEQRRVTEGGGVRFNVVMPENGMYNLTLSYRASADATANIYLDNDMKNLDRLRTSITLKASGENFGKVSQVLFLQKGINVVDIDTQGAVDLDSMRIRAKDTPAAAVVEAESGELNGEAALGTNDSVQKYASAGGYVGALKASNGVELIPENDKDFTILGLGRQVDLGNDVDQNSLDIKVTVPEAGTYKMLVYQSNGELFGKHSYNAQMTERYASFSVNGGSPKKVVFRNTYSDETFRPQVVEVMLQKGENTIRIYNDNSKVITNGVLKAGQSAHRPENIDYAVLTNYTPNFDKFEFYPVLGDNSAAEPESYQVTALASKGGSIDMDKTRVEEGGDVKLTIMPENGYVLTDAFVNGSSIMSSLTEFGGVYSVHNVKGNVTVQAIFAEVEHEVIERDTDFEYAVNAGDINPATLSEGDMFGLRNSVTDQFFAADPVTGKQWGVVDRQVSNSSYPGWLTGEKTWPCENQGVTDTTSKAASFRYLKDQPTTEAIIYQFELEAGETYDAELGFYVPSSWTHSSNPRTMKLSINGEIVSGYDSFTASNNSNAPKVINTQVTADANGMVEIQIGHASNAVWGPVISYLEIYRQPDTTKLMETVSIYEAYQKGNYTESSWQTFSDALSNAQSILADAENLTNIASINEANYQLRIAAANLASDPVADREELESLFDTCAGYVNEKEIWSLTSDDDWNAFLDALDYAQFMLDQGNLTDAQIAVIKKQLSEAEAKLCYATELKISSGPDKTSYKVGEGLDTTGLKVVAIDNRGKEHLLEAGSYTFGAFDFGTEGTKTITVKYLNFAATFTVSVVKAQEPVVPPVVQKPNATAITKTAETYNSITLTWKKIADANGYIIYRAAKKNGTYQAIKKIENPNTVTYKNSKLTFNKTYYYKIQAYKVYGSETLVSDYSQAVSAKTKLAKATVTLKKTKKNLKVKWKKIAGANGYQIQYSTNKNFKKSVKTALVKKGKTISTTLKKLTAGKKYYVRVRAYRTSGKKKIYGSWSKVKNMTVKK